MVKDYKEVEAREQEKAANQVAEVPVNQPNEQGQSSMIAGKNFYFAVKPPGTMVSQSLGGMAM